jgi:hypothetical protein
MIFLSLWRAAMEADMTEPDEQKEIYEKEGKGKVFDMYRFFSRWDVIVAAVVIVLLIVYVIASNVMGKPT